MALSPARTRLSSPPRIRYRALAMNLASQHAYMCRLPARLHQPAGGACQSTLPCSPPRTRLIASHEISFTACIHMQAETTGQYFTASANNISFLL